MSTMVTTTPQRTTSVYVTTGPFCRQRSGFMRGSASRRSDQRRSAVTATEPCPPRGMNRQGGTRDPIQYVAHCALRRGPREGEAVRPQLPAADRSRSPTDWPYAPSISMSSTQQHQLDRRSHRNPVESHCRQAAEKRFNWFEFRLGPVPYVIPGCQSNGNARPEIVADLRGQVSVIFSECRFRC